MIAGNVWVLLLLAALAVVALVKNEPFLLVVVVLIVVWSPMLLILSAHPLLLLLLLSIFCGQQLQVVVRGAARDFNRALNRQLSPSGVVQAFFDEFRSAFRTPERPLPALPHPQRPQRPAALALSMLRRRLRSASINHRLIDQFDSAVIAILLFLFLLLLLLFVVVVVVDGDFPPENWRNLENLLL